MRSAGYKLVDNEAKQSESQHVHKTDLIYDVSCMDPSSGENNYVLKLTLGKTSKDFCYVRGE